MYGFRRNNLSTYNTIRIRQILKNGNLNAVHQLFFVFKRAYGSVMGEVLHNIVIE
jgi:hypothetical protein